VELEDHSEIQVSQEFNLQNSISSQFKKTWSRVKVKEVRLKVKHSQDKTLMTKRKIWEEVERK
jgi:hypothetical protein